MKLKIVLSFLILIFFTNCKKEIPASIKLKVEFEEKTNKELPKLYSLCVYKNGKIFKQYSRFEKPYIEKEIVMDSLSNGKYKFVYMNFLNQTLEKNIYVKENKIYTISINPDYSEYRNILDKSLIGNLKENQYLQIYFESNGCFHSAKDSIIIRKKDNKYIVQTKEIIKILNKKELDAVIKMECELNLLQRGGCTTSDHYIIKYGNQKKEFYDRTCGWNGWKNMHKKLNLKKKNVSNGLAQ